MKSKQEVEAGWRGFVHSVISMYQIRGPDATELRDEIAKEVNWLITIPGSMENLRRRSVKYQLIKHSNKIEVEQFDKFRDQRINFFKWILDELAPLTPG